MVKLCQLGVNQTVPPLPTNPVNTKVAAKEDVKQPTQPVTQPVATPKVDAAVPVAPDATEKPVMPSIPKMPKISLGVGPKLASGPAGTSADTAINPQQPKEEANRPFTADQLKDAWVGLATTHKEELRLKELIENYSPTLIDHHTAEIQMPNPWQMTEMRKALPHLLSQLRLALHNDHLNIQLVQAEYNQVQMAFTAEEKFAVMAEQNPTLTQLKEQLDLQID